MAWGELAGIHVFAWCGKGLRFCSTRAALTPCTDTVHDDSIIVFVRSHCKRSMGLNRGFACEYSATDSSII